MDEAHTDLTGKLKIAISDQSSSNPRAFIAGAIRMFRDIAPGVTMDLSIEPPNVIEEGVINGRFSLGIVPSHRQSPMLTSYELYTEDMRLYCGKGHELFDLAEESFRLKELRKHDYAGLSFNSPNMAVHQKLKLRKSAFVQNEEALTLLIMSGRYLGFLPTHIGHLYKEGDWLREVKCQEARFTSQMTATVKKSASKGRRLNAFLECLISAHSKESTL
nr:substrate-binding domain-containing protein [Roseovarius albus]